MKKSLLLMLAFCGVISAQAQSPWTSAALPEDRGSYYLYNVESGMWLQNNRRHRNSWTTRVELGNYGFDFEIIKLEDGNYQLNPRFGHNHSVNGYDDYGYLDTGREVTPWVFTKDEAKGGYTIATPDETGALYGLPYEEMITFEEPDNLFDEGWYIDNTGDPLVFQLVTKEARMADLSTATKANPKDATWLIDDWDFANQNERAGSWKNEIQGGNVGYREGYNGWIANRAVECWNTGHGEYYQVIQGLPNGTYGLTVQGYYRDGSTTGIVGKREAGEETIRAWYFANDASAPFMSIIDNGVTEEVPDIFISTSGFYGPGDGGDALPRASNAFVRGYYVNKELKVVVTDGTLRIGVRKDSDVGDDWLVWDNFNLTFYGSEIDIEEVKGNLREALDEAAAYEGTVLPVLANAKSVGEAAINTTDASAIAQATSGIQQALVANKAMVTALADAEKINGAEYKPNFFTSAYSEAQSASQGTDPTAVSEAATALVNAINDANNGINAYNFFNATVPFALADGVAQSVVDDNKPAIEASTSLSDMDNALNQLRIARKIAKADKQADVFAGNAPEDQLYYYIYNVGLKRFLCGGGDWGAHAYVGFPGVEVTLIESEFIPEEGDGYSGFQIDTHLNNGGDSEFLNYGGYMDTPQRDLWQFLPVEGKPGVYNIARANGETNGAGQRMLLGYRPGTYGNIDTDMYGESDPNNQWKLVTAYDRDELLKTATNDNPQDASYKISCPNFNQREDASAWIRETENGTIYGRDGNNPDFAFECWNDNPFTLKQMIYDLEPGWYVLSCNGYYREGNHQNQVYVVGNGGEAIRPATLFGDFEETELLNITAEVNKAPGLGERRRVSLFTNEEEESWADFADDGEFYVGEFPMWIYQACNYFQTGLYKNQLLVQVDNSGELEIGVSKDNDSPEDWVVVDNFRLTYFGTQKPDMTAIENVRDEVANAKAESLTYNLQGMQVKGQLQRGLYIKDGKKVIVK